MRALAEWIDDGFFHPSSQVGEELTDVDDFVRVPVDGLTKAVQFSRVRLQQDGSSRECVVVACEGLDRRELLSAVINDRHSEADVVFLKTAVNGDIEVFGPALSQPEAAAVAVTNFRNAWDESAVIRVKSDEEKMSVRVAFDKPSDRYAVSVSRD